MSDVLTKSFHAQVHGHALGIINHLENLRILLELYRFQQDGLAEVSPLMQARDTLSAKMDIIWSWATNCIKIDYDKYSVQEINGLFTLVFEALVIIKALPKNAEDIAKFYYPVAEDEALKMTLGKISKDFFMFYKLIVDKRNETNTWP